MSSDRDLLEKIKNRSAVPVGGAPMPTMPRLDQAVINKTIGIQNTEASKRLLTPEEQKKLVESGKFISGVGSGYVSNQPGYAASQTVEPTERPKASLSPSTVEGLNKLAEVQNNTNNEELYRINQEIEDLDDEFITDEFGNRIRSLLANKDRRKAIEDRCGPLSFDDLLVNGSVEQLIPIYPNKFEVTFRSTYGHEDDFLNEIIAKVKGSERQVLDRFALYRLTCGLVKVNNSYFRTCSTCRSRS